MNDQKQKIAEKLCERRSYKDAHYGHARPQKMVTAVGQTIGVIVAENTNVARQAAGLVTVEYEDLPAVTNIQDAICGDLYYGEPVIVERGDVDGAFSETEHSMSGEIRIGGQEHLYMETMSSLVIPGEGKEWTIHCGTQDVPRVQEAAANILGVKQNQCVVKVKRVGGGFGGKLSQFSRSLWPALVAAEKLRRPIKCVLMRRDDIIMTGKRHPGYCKYKVGFSSEGKITALESEIYLDGGHTTDQSLWVREINFLKQGLRSFTEDLVRDNNLQKCWEECIKFSKFYEQKNSVDLFNKERKWRKLGIALLPTRFGIGMAGDSLEQGAALVNIYTDGTVMVTHAGLELGQGLNTKIHQIASRELSLPMNKITILDHSTDKVPNATVTGGSMGSDIHGLAVQSACKTLMNRLKPVIRENPKGTWEKWIETAYKDRISLSATGIGLPRYDTNDPKEKVVGNPRYYVPGAACTIVEIDCLTGDHTVLKTDIVMDVGNSINPAIDIGQIEGGFLQGYGLFVTEELVYSKCGQLLTDSAGKYKIPTTASVPREFRISLLKGSTEPYNIYSSKGIGEPPFFLGCSAFFAIKQAINSYRIQNGFGPTNFPDSPATPERIRLACEDRFTELV